MDKGLSANLNPEPVVAPATSHAMSGELLPSPKMGSSNSLLSPSILSTTSPNVLRIVHWTKHRPLDDVFGILLASIGTFSVPSAVFMEIITEDWVTVRINKSIAANALYRLQERPMNEDQSPMFGKLKKPFRNKRAGQIVKFPAHSIKWPSREIIRDRFRKDEASDSAAEGNKKAAIRAANERLIHLKRGKSVSWQLVTVLAELLEVDPFVIADPCLDEPDEIDIETPWWHKPWQAMFDVLALLFKQFIDPPALAKCENTEEDVRFAASMFLEWLGRYSHGGKENTSLSKYDAIRLGEQSTSTSLERFVQLFWRLVKFNSDSVRFTVAPDKNGVPKRVGLTVMVPLTEDAYWRFRLGQIDPPDFSDSDFQDGSQYLMTLAVAEVSSTEFENRKIIADAQLPNMIWQFALLCGNRSIEPHLIALAGSPESERRLVAHSYQMVGARSPKSHFEIMEIAPKPASAPVDVEAAKRHSEDYGFVKHFFFLVWLIACGMAMAESIGFHKAKKVKHAPSRNKSKIKQSRPKKPRGKQ